MSSRSILEKRQLSPQKEVAVVYQYADGTPVAGALCSIFDQNRALVAEGPITAAPKTIFKLPNHVSRLYVEFSKDPLIRAYLRQPFPNPEIEKAEPGWFDRMAGAMQSAGDWTWGVIAGDFNENPTLSQIITNTLITMIPVVDQVSDLRDISACVKLLLWDEKYDEYMVWVGLGLTAVGLVPGVGSLVKGILKAVFNKVPIDRLIKAFNKYAKGHAPKYLKNLQNGGLKELQKKVVQTIHEILNSLQAKLAGLQDMLPPFTGPVREKVLSILDALEETQKRIESMSARLFDELAERLDQAMGQKFKLAFEGPPNRTYGYKQMQQEPPVFRVDGGVEKEYTEGVGGAGPKTTVKKKVEPGGQSEKYNTFKTNADVPSKYSKDQRFDDLASDPDHAGKISSKTRQEAMAGLEAESQGLIKKPIERGPKGIEFYDGDGNPWDVKAPPSPPEGKNWRFDAEQAGDSIIDELRKPDFPNKTTGNLEKRKVILDSSYMNEADHKALRDYIKKEASKEELGRIVEITTDI